MRRTEGMRSPGRKVPRWMSCVILAATCSYRYSTTFSFMRERYLKVLAMRRHSSLEIEHNSFYPKTTVRVRFHLYCICSGGASGDKLGSAATRRPTPD